MTMNALAHSRLVSLLALALFALMPAVAYAQTVSTAPITVEVIDLGELVVEFGPGDLIFRTKTGDAPRVTTSSGATAYASLPVVISDTRLDSSRTPYRVQLSVSGMSAEGAGQGVSLTGSSITVTGASGVPKGLLPGFAAPAELDEPVTIFRTPAEPPVGTWTVQVHLVLEIPAGMIPGTFDGSVSLKVIPGS